MLTRRHTPLLPRHVDLLNNPYKVMIDDRTVKDSQDTTQDVREADSYDKNLLFTDVVREASLMRHECRGEAVVLLREGLRSRCPRASIGVQCLHDRDDLHHALHQRCQTQWHSHTMLH